MITMTECIHGMADPTQCGFCNPPSDVRRVPAASEWAATVMSWIPAIGRDWITGDELAEVSGLTRDQVSAAVAWIRDHEPEFPLVSGASGYRFSIDEADVNRYRASAFRTAHTRIRRSWRGVVKPYLEQSNLDPTRIRQITRSFERLLEDIEDLTR